ncbi:transcription factor TGA2-like isoform X2 [Hibiscus syriacus]|uniref:transcription factor TGA2-like isoform X2 n=1 Tax=Hibiscus syriacus TaxID=106335 RepID=UPI0019234352|nr:transcription factor TGA2-like isoform X2 [Hibiscus syriacus]
MERRTSVYGAKDENKAANGIPGFDPPLPITNILCSKGTTIHPFPASDLDTFDQSVGLCLEDAVNLSANIAFDSANVSRQEVPSDRNLISNSDKTQISFNIYPSTDQAQSPRLQLENSQQTNLVSIPSGTTENWGESNMADSSPKTDISTDADTDERSQRFDRGKSSALVAVSDSSDRSKGNLDQKTLRRLAQNREAARKSRLRKKAYVQQLESSRLKLTQLEQELQRARQQGIFISSSGDPSHSMSGNGAMAFDVEYARWLEEQNRKINELRTAVNSHASDAELRIIVDGVMAHYDEIFRLKSNASKADVFHLLSGMWKTPAERCFLWLGGFRSSELLKLLVSQLEPLTEQQLVGIGNLQQSSQQAEDALSQGMEALQQSLAETLSTGSLGSSGSSGNVANYMGQMAMAMGKLGTLEGFIRQADNLRQQTLQQMHRILTTRQSARALLAIHDYFSRLRALSSLWLARPRE